MTHTPEQKAHILSIVEADLDGRTTSILLHDIPLKAYLDYDNLKTHPERYRLKAETVMVYLQQERNGARYASFTKSSRTIAEHEFTVPPKAPETQSDEIELREQLAAARLEIEHLKEARGY